MSFDQKPPSPLETGLKGNSSVAAMSRSIARLTEPLAPGPGGTSTTPWDYPDNDERRINALTFHELYYLGLPIEGVRWPSPGDPYARVRHSARRVAPHVPVASSRHAPTSHHPGKLDHLSLPPGPPEIYFN